VSHSRYVEHIFQGICICSCKQCTTHAGTDVVCICPDCDRDKCGAKQASGVKR
jgi:hypothetical protein